MTNIVDDFDLNNKYKLYRNLYEILHPTISKKNISDYKIVLDDSLMPIRVFYPKKVSLINSFIIYIHGNGDVTGCRGFYSSVCEEMAKKTNKLILAIDYNFDADNSFDTLFNSCYELVSFLYERGVEFGIEQKNIAVMGDSFGASLAVAIANKALEQEDFRIEKEILLYPILNDNYKEYKGSNKASIARVEEFYKDIDISDNLMSSYLFPLKKMEYKNMPHTLIVTGNIDCFKEDGVSYFNLLDDKNSKYFNIDFLEHGFLNNSDKESLEQLYLEIRNFLM